jgi:hypothetical protein
VSYKTACTELRNAGLIGKRTPTGRIRIGESQLRECLPEYYRRIHRYYAMMAPAGGGSS